LLLVSFTVIQNKSETILAYQARAGWKIDKTKRKLAELTSLMEVLEADDELTNFNTKYNLSRTLRSYSKGFLHSLYRIGIGVKSFFLDTY